MNKPVLLVEDEESDVIFMQIAMEQAGIKNPLQVARDGRQAVACIKGEGVYADRKQYPMPGLVLLDLRLPGIPGLKVLEWIRQQPESAGIPIFILSSSDQDPDVETAYRLGAQAYLVKPPLLSDLSHMVRIVKQCWIDADSPPPDCKEWQALIVPPPRTEKLVSNPAKGNP